MCNGCTKAVNASTRSVPDSASVAVAHLEFSTALRLGAFKPF